MGYHVVDPSDVEPAPDRPSTQRPIADHVGLDRVAVNRYEIGPGERGPLAYHYHEEQEEVFYVAAGDLHVRTPDGEYVVEAGEFFVAEPDHPHLAYNPEDADRTVRAIAIGAPRVDDVHRYEPDP